MQQARVKDEEFYPRGEEDRRKFSYTLYIPERRSGKDRRKKTDN